MSLFPVPSRAVFDESGCYRYALWREWQSPFTKRCLFIMLNPSTADSEQLDPTVTRCVDFAKRWGYEALDVGNAYGWRATDPSWLREAANPVGPLNDFWLQKLVDRSSRIIVAWGNHCSPERADRVIEICGTRSQVYCFKVTKEGMPEHPLYQRSSAIPIPYVHPFRA